MTPLSASGGKSSGVTAGVPLYGLSKETWNTG